MLVNKFINSMLIYTRQTVYPYCLRFKVLVILLLYLYSMHIILSNRFLGKVLSFNRQYCFIAIYKVKEVHIVNLYIVVLLANIISDSFLVYFRVPLSVIVISAII